MERSLAIVTGRMLSSFVALALFMMYLNHSCNAKSLPSISPEKNGMVANSWTLLQNSEYEKENLICLSAGCVKAAAFIINNMDQSVDPCDDFYQFACGNFIKNTILKDNEGSRDEITSLLEVITNQTRMLVTEPIQPDELRPFKMMKLMFKSCMDQERIEKIGLGPFKGLLKSLGGWPLLEAENWNESKFTWMDSQNIFKEMGQNINYLFRLYIDADNKKKTKRTIYLHQASFEVPQMSLVQGTNNIIVDTYYRYMVDIAVIFGADRQRATEELRESLDFEIELAKISMPPEEGSDILKTYNPMNIADLQQKFPSIPWQEFLNKLLNPFIRQDDIIIVSSPKYWSGLGTLLSKTPKRVQANYIIWRSVNDAVLYLTEELRRIKYTYLKQIQSTNELPRWKACADTSAGFFEISIGSMFVRRFFNENVKNNALEIANGIQKELYKILLSNEWMDDETRKFALDKAKAMTKDIAYHDDLLDDEKLNSYYENLEVNDQDYYISVMNMTKFKTGFEFSKFKKSVMKSDYWITLSSYTTMVNAFYFPSDNHFIVPAGILQGIFFSTDRPQYMNFGGVGSVIGHEITHGFDNSGRQFDKHGNKVDWWAEEANKKFLEKEKCVINQYGNYTDPEFGFKVNSTLTLSENIADLGGSTLSYNAYREWVKENGVEPRLPGLQEYTPRQMFWLSNANLWCSKETEAVRNYMIKHETHTINRFRIIGSLSNMKDFSNDFQCPLGSNMNPANKCKLW